MGGPGVGKEGIKDGGVVYCIIFIPNNQPLSNSSILKTSKHVQPKR